MRITYGRLSITSILADRSKSGDLHTGSGVVGRRMKQMCHSKQAQNGRVENNSISARFGVYRRPGETEWRAGTRA